MASKSTIFKDETGVDYSRMNLLNEMQNLSKCEILSNFESDRETTR